MVINREVIEGRAQPLYVHALQIAGQVRDVLIVGTGGNSIYAFDASKPALGVAAVMSALPVLIPIVILLMRRLGRSEVQL